MNKFAVITIDTEPDCDTRWIRSNPLKFDSISFGVKSILQPLFDKYNVKPVYFVSPEVIGDSKSLEILKVISDDNRCEIGNHLHGEYVEPEKDFYKYDGTNSDKYICFDYDDNIEFEKIKNYDRQLTEAFNKKPTSFRAARYGADTNTIRSLSKLGYTVDSSVTPNIDWSKQNGPNFRSFKDQPYLVDMQDFSKEDKGSKVLEIPITVGKKRFFFLPDKWFFYRWLRPTHMFVWEQKKMIDDFIQKNKDRSDVVLCITFHSMEVIPKATPFVRTWFESKMLVKRLEKTIRYLQEKGFSFKMLKEIKYQK